MAELHRHCSDGSPRRRCVVLVRPGGSVPSWLVRGLDHHGADSVLVDGPMAVMLELARSPTHAVVVDQPKNVAAVDELLTAIQTYYPQVVCWCHEATGTDHQPRLSRLRTASPSNGNGGGRTSADARKTIDDGPASQSAGALGSVEPDQATESSLLTQEELTMLLGPAAENGRSATDVSREER